MNKLTDILTISFFVIMIIFTFTSRKIHAQKIPHVKAITVSKQDFIYKFTDESGNEFESVRRSVGIPKYLNCDELYVIIEDEIYGEKRNFAEKVNVVKNENYCSDDYYSVSYGVKAGDKLIVSDNISMFGEERIEVYYDGE